MQFCSLFDDPDREERALYAKYWQNKLHSNKELSFPDDLVEEIATMTDKFSFAYLKEALFVQVSALTVYGFAHVLQCLFTCHSCGY